MKDALPLIGAIIGGLLAIVGGFLAHVWSRTRERWNRRDQLRLDLYLDVVALIIEDEKIMAAGGEPRQMPPMEHQAKQYSISHRLKLLGSPDVQGAYKEYHDWVFKETTHPIRPASPDYVVQARDRLIAKMRADIDGK